VVRIDPPPGAQIDVDWECPKILRVIQPPIPPPDKSDPGCYNGCNYCRETNAPCIYHVIGKDRIIDDDGDMVMADAKAKWHVNREVSQSQQNA